MSANEINWFSTFVETFDMEELRKVVFSQEHFHDGCLDIYELAADFKVTVLSAEGFLRFPVVQRKKLPVYNYCPDERILTFKMLGKPSPGLSPPASPSICQ